MNKSDNKYKIIFENLHDIYYETEENGTIITISPSIKKYTEYEHKEVTGKNIKLLFKGNKYKGIFLKILLSKESVSNYEMQLTDKNGKIHHTLVSANIIRDIKGNVIKISGLIKDICDLKATTDELYQFATYDELTGVYNRRVGMEFLKQELKKMRRGKTYLSICYIDINDLKIVNDNFGHDAGDNLILAIVEDIKSAMRESDILSRIGGDEFLLIFPDCKLSEVKLIWRRVQKSMEERNKNPDIKYNISASYGFAETDSENILFIDELIQIADKRMYAHKRRAKIEKFNNKPIKYY
ncbi:MAG: sensor domain-containing diguanylate cyclase [Spirochaetales bacterium]|nr:sensor domain-containing diguanylate cyclase [Spirochaetales bacterium]